MESSDEEKAHRCDWPGCKASFAKARKLVIHKRLHKNECKKEYVVEKKRSKLWNYFTDSSNGKARCNLCHSEYSMKGGSTSNLKKHLCRKHPSYSEGQSGGFVLSNVKSLSSTPTSTSKNHKLAQNLRHQRRPTKKPIFVQTPTLSEARANKISDLVFNMIVTDLQPFSVVEDSGFVQLIKYLEPGFEIPSAYSLSTTSLDAKYTDVKTRLKTELESASFISLTTDGWTSPGSSSYQAVIAHYIADWELKSAFLGCFECHEWHTAEYIKLELYNLVSEWEISDKIFACVTDESNNLKAAVSLAGFEHFSCVAHSLNLIVSTSLCTIEGTLNKIRTIVELFQTNAEAEDLFIGLQEQLDQLPLKLIMDDVTKWITTLSMIERLTILKDPLETALGILQNPEETLTESDWQILPEVIKILKPLRQITQELSTKTQITISKVLAATDSVSRFLESLRNELKTDVAQFLLSNLKTDFNNKFKNSCKHPILSQAALLDPRFKRLAFRDEYAFELAQNKIQKEFEQSSFKTNVKEPSKMQISQDNEIDIWKDFDDLASTNCPPPNAVCISTMRQYLEERNIARNECPLKWWEARSMLYPELAELATKFLSVMATSILPEKLFDADDLMAARRSFLKPKYLPKRPFWCDYSDCEKSYTSGSHLKRHVESAHIKSKKYECSICQLKVTTSTNLKRHKARIHTEGKSSNYSCDVCSQSFYKKHQLKEHQTFYHNGEVAYQCSKCSLGFVRERDFKQHNLKRHSRPRYTCHCGESFEKWTQILAHKRQQHKIKFTCEVCDKKFDFKSRLLTHKTTHSDEKEGFVCPVEECGRIFLYKRNLTQHYKNIHEGLGFQCEKCEKVLSTNQKLKEHVHKMHEMVKEKKARKKPKTRKDKGIPKRSVIVKLAGLQGVLDRSLEAKVLQGEKIDIENLIELPVLSESESVKSDRSRKSDASVRSIGAN